MKQSRTHTYFSTAFVHSKQNQKRKVNPFYILHEIIYKVFIIVIIIFAFVPHIGTVFVQDNLQQYEEEKLSSLFYYISILTASIIFSVLPASTTGYSSKWTSSSIFIVTKTNFMFS